MPKRSRNTRRVGGSVRHREAKDTSTIWYFIIAIVIIYLIFFSIYVFSTLKKFESAQNGKTTIASSTLGFSENEKLIAANIIACGTNVQCVNIFNQRNYQCQGNTAPTCVDKFCVCK